MIIRTNDYVFISKCYLSLFPDSAGLENWRKHRLPAQNDKYKKGW